MDNPDFSKPDGDGIVILTDRWGDIILPLRAEPMPSDDALEALRCAMERTDEDSFVVTRHGDLGLLIEIEYDDNAAPTDSDREAVAKVAAEHPECAVWLSDDPRIFNGRHAARAFLPAAVATASLAGAIRTAFAAFLY